MLCPLPLVKVIMPPPSPPSFSLCYASLPVLPSHKAALDLHFCQGNWSIWLLPRYNSTPPPSLILPYHPSLTPHRAHFQISHIPLSLHFCSLFLTKRLISAGKCSTLVHESTCGLMALLSHYMPFPWNLFMLC